jgi:adenosylhomocysteinase
MDFRVADLSLAEFGRKEIRLAEHEMPGLMAMRAQYGELKPLAGARIAGSLHMTVQTAVLIETLIVLGAQVRWASCTSSPPRTTRRLRSSSGRRDRRRDPRVPARRKGETLEEYWWCTDQILSWPDQGFANMILDDGVMRPCWSTAGLPTRRLARSLRLPQTTRRSGGHPRPAA